MDFNFSKPVLCSYGEKKTAVTKSWRRAFPAPPLGGPRGSSTTDAFVRYDRGERDTLWHANCIAYVLLQRN